MTVERITVKGLTDDESNTFNHLLEKLDDKKNINLLRASYYDGKRALRQVGSVIPPQYYRLAIALGWSAKAVDALSRRCNLDGLIWPDGELDALGFRETWNGNRLRTEISSALASSLLHGISFLVNTRGDESAARSPDLFTSRMRYRRQVIGIPAPVT